MPDIMTLFVSHKEWAVRTARLMVGVPHYDTYVQHRQTNHPGKPIMTYEEFFVNVRKRATPAAKDGSEVAADFQGVQERALGACLAIRRGNLFRCRPILPR